MIAAMAEMTRAGKAGNLSDEAVLQRLTERLVQVRLIQGGHRFLVVPFCGGLAVHMARGHQKFNSGSCHRTMHCVHIPA
jgi:hypothetical protein